MGPWNFLCVLASTHLNENVRVDTRGSISGGENCTVSNFPFVVCEGIIYQSDGLWSNN